MMHPLRAAPLPLSLAAALLLAGCAAAPPPLGVPASAEAPPSLYGEKGAGTSPVDDEMLAIGKSEAELDRLLPSRKKEPSQGAEQQRGDKMSNKDDAPAEGDRCAIACRALASMTRSAEHLCSLAGDGDGRCDDARGRVRGAGARVHAACPTCAAQP